MRTLTTLFAAAALSIGGIGAASAQELAPAPAAPSDELQPQTMPSAELHAQPIMTGESVFNIEGEEIGTVDEVSIDANGSQNAVISVGEFLGLGGKQVLIPASELSARAEGGYNMSFTAEQLEQMPEHQGG